MRRRAFKPPKPQRVNATRQEWLAAADKLAAAVMEAASEVRDDSATLATMRDDITQAIREWDDLAWHNNPYLANRVEPDDAEPPAPSVPG